jgi:predicted Zn finger-like uncharacterized protein
MATHTICPSCGARFSVADDVIGKSARCKKCNTKFRIASGRGVPIHPPQAIPAVRDRSAAEAEDGVPSEWHVGDVILDLYEVTDFLGEGGMGKVYRVRHRGWNVDLAVKCPRPQILKKPNAIEDFEREAEVWVNLGLHPNIVCCHYVRRLGSIPRLFAEFVEAGSLAEWIRDGRLYEGGSERALERTLDVAIQFAWGLHYAHELGLVHQDVKPANVMMTSDGIAKVTDFGLAKATAAAGQPVVDEGRQNILVSSGGMTPAYCSPEQAERRLLSRKTDIWSWAVSVLEMFIGDVTWPAGSVAAEALEAYLNTGSDDLTLPRMPPRLASVLRQCFQRDRTARPNDMLEIAAVLQQVYEQTTGRSYPRAVPKPAEALANSLNNQAVSLLDLGRREESEKLWERSLQAEPHHPEATYNRGLMLWRSGRLSDTVLLQQMGEVQTSHSHTWRDEFLLGLVHLERGDPAAAVRVLEQVETAAGVSREALETLDRARAALSQRGESVQLLKSPESQPHVVWVDSAGRRAVSGDWDGKLRVWELATGKCVRTLEGHRGLVRSLAVDATGRWCVSGGDDDSVRLWNLDASSCIRTLANGTAGVYAVAITTDGRLALAGGKDGRILAWDIPEGKCLRTLRGHRFHVLAVALSGDGRQAFSAGRDRSVRVWDISAGTLVRSIQGHEADIAVVAVASGGNLLITGSHDRTLRVWDPSTGSCSRILTGHTDWVRAVALASNETTAISGSSDGAVRVWDLDSGACVRSLETGDREVTGVALSSDASLIRACGSSGIHVWRSGSRGYRAPFVLSVPLAAAATRSFEEQVKQLQSHAEQHLNHGEYAQAARLIARARQTPGYSQHSGLLKLHGRTAAGGRTRRLSAAWQVRCVGPARGGATCLAALPSGSRFLAGHEDGTVCLWDAHDGACLQVWHGHTKSVSAVAVSRDGRRALSGALFPARELRVWDVSTGDCLRQLEARGTALTSLGLSPDGRFAVANAGDTLDKRGHFYAIELESGNNIQRMDCEVMPPKTVALAPDGELIAASGWSSSVIVCDLNQHGRRRHLLEGHQGAVASLAFTPDACKLLSGSSDRTMRLWDVATAQCLRVFEGHTDWVTSVAVSPDGHWAMSGGNDGTVRIWNLATGECARTLAGSGTAVAAVAFTADSQFGLSVPFDGSIQISQLDWELEFPDPGGWDNDLVPYLKLFMNRHTPLEFGWGKWQKTGPPRWGEGDFKALIADLTWRGFGWISPERVKAELDTMMAAGTVGS